MTGRTSLLAYFWPLRRALGAIVLVFSFASVVLGEEGRQWRINKIDDGRILLAFSRSEATDDILGLRFYCKPSSGRIEVFHDTSTRERELLADLIRADSYPRVELEGEASFMEPSYSEVAGWEYHFEIAVDGAAFNKFQETGQLRYKIGLMVVKNEPKGGLDKISEFQAACRKPPANQVLDWPKAQR